jgi:alkylhydroperoxidase/carboxymuconolactone decarboxylase family protein YurZ
VLLISRGRPVAERLAEALIEVFGGPEPGPPSDGPPDREQALAYFESYFGAIPPRVSYLAERSETAFAGYALLHRSALREGALPPVLVELILCGVNAADLQTEFVAIHAGAARRQGATEEQLLGAVLAVIPVSGVAVWPGAATALTDA